MTEKNKDFINDERVFHYDFGFAERDIKAKTLWEINQYYSFEYPSPDAMLEEFCTDPTVDKRAVFDNFETYAFKRGVNIWLDPEDKKEIQEEQTRRRTMNNAKLYTELESAAAFSDYGKELQERFNLDKNPACIGNWLIRDQSKKPFCSNPFLMIKSTDIDEIKKWYDTSLTKPLNKEVSIETFQTITKQLFKLRDNVLAEGKEYLKQHEVGPHWNRELAEYHEPAPWEKRLGKDGYEITEKQNDDFEAQGYASYRQAFKEIIEVGEDNYFSIYYGDLIANQSPYFSTVYDGKDFGGQAQELLKDDSPNLYDFHKRWSRFYGSALTLVEMDTLKKEVLDLEHEMKFPKTFTSEKAKSSEEEIQEEQMEDEFDY